MARPISLAVLAIGLLLAVDLAVPFSLPSFASFFEDSATSTVYLHPLSPKEADPEAVRVKRQAYQVSVGEDVSISVDKLAETGVWGHWAQEKECSRQCGGGVQVEKRTCNGECTGPSVRYVSCNLEPCDEPTDFRAEQCAKHNDDPLDGNYFKWKPYAGKNKCELTCKPETASFYYKWADKVVDGTKCDDDSNLSENVCVDGVCVPLGCDGKIGSAAKSDKCGVCNGNDTTCKTIDGTFDERNLSPGYHDIIVLPVGATSIKVEEIRPTKNNLAIKNTTGHFYLNGNYQIQVLDKDVVVVGGTAFKYDKPEKAEGVTEKLSAKGPLKEELTIALLYQPGTGGSKNSAVKYEFSIPLEEDVQYLYKPGQWSGCSVTCGAGVITRTPFCIDTLTQQRVSDEVCDENNATKPEYEKPCQTVDCEAEWYIGDWEECSQVCGDGGWQYRVIYCHKIFADGRRITVSDGNCSEVDRPAVKQTCNRFSCPEWQAGPWSACSEKCGDARQYRSVTCRSQKEGEEGKLLAADSCTAEGKADSERSCNLGPCEGLNFKTTEWNLCQRCNDTEETRNVTCNDKSGRRYPLEKCLNDTISQIPIDTRACATQAPCIYEWHSSQWSKCSTECGHGHKTRKTHCAINEIGDISIVDEGLCSGEKPPVKEECINEEKCNGNGTYFTGPWSECSEKCNGGKQSRVVVCLNYDQKPVPEWCDESMQPADQQECNVDPCPTCHDSDFGCCPDNSTFATGEFLQGCSNCSVSEFGCCNDNVTEASGANGKGCLEYVEVEGSGEESAVESTTEPEKQCEVTNEETGEKIKVSCSVTIAPSSVEDLLDSVEGGNGTENATKHCSKTEFKCCPDWYTAAEGKENDGCPQFTLGSCNETKHGCCIDGVTLSRGPNMEGCGEPSCAASLYGCCKDRKTIAFGPHYSGCERSSFPCELATFGCCPDGETAALSKNLTGCGASCLLTKFGCCPDGVTQSKGVNNEGCGCEFAQYGCCPDGKSAAKGAGYYGCPETCAQSQHGCCPDGKTAARGANKEGCPCQYTRWGCCPDGETTALGPRNDGCDDCRYAKHGCCADGVSKALGPAFAGCPTTTPPPHVIGGTVAPGKIVSCNLPQDQGQVCHPGYKLVWFFDTTEGRCSQFWFGGCGGNENNFASKELCEQVCVEPPELGRCYLPKNEGPQRCSQLVARYWYDYTTKQCAAFWWRGCLGNSNNFGSWEECQHHCSSVGPESVPVPVSSNDLGRTPYRPPVQPTRQPYPNWPQQTPPSPRQPVLSPYPQQPQDVRLSEGVSAKHPLDPFTRQQSFPSSSDSCRQTVDSGNCDSYQDLWYFDAFSAKCYSFIYSGCGGNSNRYGSLAECQMKCGHLKPDFSVRKSGGVAETQQQQQPRSTARPTTSPYIQQQPQQQQPQPNRKKVERPKSRDICNLRLDVGRCEGHFDSWYYEVATGLCEQFQYSGCGGNANRFHNKEQCENLCMRGVPHAPRLGSVSSFGPQQQSEQQTHVGAILEKVANAKNAVVNALGIGSSAICEAQKDTGSCNRFVTKWFYNKGDGTCNRFHYGGCGGNENRFETEQECKDKCGEYIDTCFLPKVIGPCAGKNERYFFDQSTKQCTKFEYSGCLGNNNNFRQIEDCETRCASPSSLITGGVPSFFSSGNQLDVPALSGSEVFSRPVRQQALSPSEMAVASNLKSSVQPPATYYVEEVSDAEEKDGSVDVQSSNAFFQSNAVGGNKPVQYPVSPNQRYMDQGELAVEQHAEGENDEQDMVTMFPQTIHSLPELCSLPEERGSCFGKQLRWRFDSEALQCTSFMYSGCDNNANYFTSVEACERACGDYRHQRVCEMTHDAGTCGTNANEDRQSPQSAVTAKWFFDHRLGKCHSFMWSGCGGNGNRFSSKSECEDLCKREALHEEVDSCGLMRDSGPCSDQLTQWYFDSAAKQCRKFTYGGCRGNANRFNSKDLCQKECQSMPFHSKKLEMESTPKEICSLSFEAGPCDGMEKRFFFDFNAQQCKPFTYGGCDGNSNRFLSLFECLEQCKAFVRMNETGEAKQRHRPELIHRFQRAKVISAQPGPFTVGSNVQLRCAGESIEGDLNGNRTWYLNEVEIGLNNFGTIRQFKFSEDHQTLIITNVDERDAGDYACAVGTVGMISESYVVVVEALPQFIECFDKGSPSTCNMILKTGLCSNIRYGKFCCKTCSNSANSSPSSTQ